MINSETILPESWTTYIASIRAQSLDLINTVGPNPLAYKLLIVPLPAGGLGLLRRLRFPI